MVAWSFNGEYGSELHLTHIAPAGSAPDRVLSPDTIGDATRSKPGACTASHPAWSPDGKQFAFMSVEREGKNSLRVVRTTGGAASQKLVDGVYGVISWMPDGKWIAYPDDNSRWHLISPDGKQHRDLGIIKTDNLGFSKDSKTAYGIREEGGKLFLFSLDVETAKLHDIKPLDSSLQPRSPLNPAVRFTLAPDGKSFAYSIAKPESSVWMLQGFDGK